MAHSLQLNVVVEGVELKEHETLLLAHRCREAQGFHYAHPMSANELSLILSKKYQLLEPLNYQVQKTDSEFICCLLEGQSEPCGDDPELVCLQLPGRPLACQSTRFCEKES